MVEWGMTGSSSTRNDKKRFQYCSHSDGLIMYLRVIQSHSGGTKVDSALLDNVDISNRWTEFLHHVDCCRKVHPIFQAELIDERYLYSSGSREQSAGRGVPWFVETTKGVQCNSKWQIIQDAIHWMGLKKAEDEGLNCWQTRSHFIIFYASVPIAVRKVKTDVTK